jgi:transketolase
MLHAAMEAAESLAVDGVDVRVISMHRLEPLDKEAVFAAARETQAIITLEEHSIVGGLGSSVAELLAESSGRVPFRRKGVPHRFSPRVGSQEFMLGENGLDLEGVRATVANIMGRADIIAGSR